MDDQNMNSTENTSEAPAPAPAPLAGPAKNPAYGTILGIVLIVVILVVGAFYVWGERLEKEYPVPTDGSSSVENGTRGTVEVDVAVPEAQ